MKMFQKEHLKQAPKTRWVFLCLLAVFSFLGVGEDKKNSVGIETLSCSDVFKLSDWSIERWHGVGPFSMGLQASADKVIHAYIEKVDPNKLIFLKSELDELRKRVNLQWKDFLKNKNCALFDHWLEKYLTASLKRLEVEIKKEEAKYKKLASALPKESKYKRPENYTVSIEEWKIRVQEYSKYLLQETGEKLIEVIEAKENTLSNYIIKQATSDSLSAHSLLAKAMLSAFDTYSTFFTNTEFDEFYSELSGAVSGIGIQVTQLNSGLLIEKVLPNSPASRLGKIEAGDIILSVDGVELSGLSFVHARQQLKGEEKSTVSLLVEKKNHEKLSLKLVREAVLFEESKITEKKIGENSVLIQVPSFYGRGGVSSDSVEMSVSEDVKSMLTNKISKVSNLSALILDLRGNPGGYLEEAVQLAGLFIGKKTVVGVKESGQMNWMRSEEEAIYHGPLYVLVDENTASAAEVLANALKDWGRAVILGSERTFGKGSVQKLFYFENSILPFGIVSSNAKGVMKLTTSTFYSPSGHSPLNGGVTSDLSWIEKKENKTQKADFHVDEVRSQLPANSVEEIKKIQAMRMKAISSWKEEAIVRYDRYKKVESDPEIKIVSDFIEFSGVNSIKSKRAESQFISTSSRQ